MELTLPQQAVYFLLVAPIAFYLTFWFHEGRKKEINIHLAIFSWFFGMTIWAALTLFS